MYMNKVAGVTRNIFSKETICSNILILAAILVYDIQMK